MLIFKQAASHIVFRQEYEDEDGKRSDIPPCRYLSLIEIHLDITIYLAVQLCTLNVQVTATMMTLIRTSAVPLNLILNKNHLSIGLFRLT